MFEYTRWLNASANAFNLELAELMPLSTSVTQDATSTAVTCSYNFTKGSFVHNDQRLFEGPDQIVIEDIVETDGGLIEVKTCHRESTYWAQAGRAGERTA